ncbi:MAG: helix-turn-helix domain-containing protein [Oscillibacter sp.]|nr:helix-turn-helix domain-containing protein [Oscillibacter sp.]
MIKFRLQEILDQKGKSRYWLSRQTGISHQNLTKMANHKTKAVRLETIEILCQVLECTPNDLFVIDFDQPEDR